MCQITLTSSLGNFPYKGILSYLLVKNSEKNQDGWGFFEPITNTLYKVKTAANADDNVYTVFSHLPTNNNVKILSHVRLASVNKGSITDENAHPFEKDTLILAHNGTLLLKVGTLPANITDSEYFAGLLDEEYKKSYDMVSALKETYKLFDGKFAFVIYSKTEDKFYIARGSSATLYKTLVTIKHGNRTKHMLIINTEKDTLTEALETSAYFLAYNQPQDDLTYSAPELLPANSIFTFNDLGLDLVPLEKLVETTRIYYYQNNRELPASGGYKSRTYTEPLGSDFTRLGKALYRTGLSVTQVEKLLCIAFDAHCIQDLVDINPFKISNLVEKYYTKKKQKIWQRIVARFGSQSEDDVYTKTGLEFPYFINDKISLVEALRKCQKTIS